MSPTAEAATSPEAGEKAAMGIIGADANVNGVAQGDQHPLQHKWVLWYDNSKLKKVTETWEDNLKRIMEFDTVEGFWSLFNNILPPSLITVGSNYSVFKDGIKPMWEDKANFKGGKFVLTVDRRDAGLLDDWWLRGVLAAVGEILEADDSEAEVCGLVVSVRKGQNRISLWTRTCEEPTALPAGRKLKEALNMPLGVKIKFQKHDEALASLSSFQNNAHFEV